MKYGELIVENLTPSQSVKTDANKQLVSSQASITFVLDSPVATDVFPICQVPVGITVTKVTATVKGGTSITFNIEQRSSSTLASAGTNVMTSSLVATTTGANTTSFSGASISAYAFLVFVASAASGTPTQIVITIEYS